MSTCTLASFQVQSVVLLHMCRTIIFDQKLKEMMQAVTRNRNIYWSDLVLFPGFHLHCTKAEGDERQGMPGNINHMKTSGERTEVRLTHKQIF